MSIRQRLNSLVHHQLQAVNSGNFAAISALLRGTADWRIPDGFAGDSAISNRMSDTIDAQKIWQHGTSAWWAPVR